MKSNWPDSIQASKISNKGLEIGTYVGGEGPVESLDGGAVGPLLDEMPLPQRPQRALDGRLAGICLRLRPAPPTLKQTTEESRDLLLSSRKAHMLAAIPSAASAAEVACPAVRGVAARATDLGGEEDESERGTKPMGVASPGREASLRARGVGAEARFGSKLGRARCGWGGIFRPWRPREEPS